METVYGPETRAAWIARQRAARLELRERMWAEAVRDPHWLKRANVHLAAALDENETRYGLNRNARVDLSVLELAEAAQDEPVGVYHPAAEGVPVEEPAKRASGGWVSL